MLKKIILLLLVFFSFNGINIALDCDYYGNGDGTVSENIEKCINDGTFGGVIPPDGSLDLAHGESFGESLKEWSIKISILVGSIAVFMLVYASFLLVVSAGEEEKVKKAKDIIKWTVLGFIGLLMAGLIVMLIVKLGYFFGQT